MCTAQVVKQVTSHAYKRTCLTGKRQVSYLFEWHETSQQLMIGLSSTGPLTAIATYKFRYWVLSVSGFNAIRLKHVPCTALCWCILQPNRQCILTDSLCSPAYDVHSLHDDTCSSCECMRGSKLVRQNMCIPEKIVRQPNRALMCLHADCNVLTVQHYVQRHST